VSAGERPVASTLKMGNGSTETPCLPEPDSGVSVYLHPVHASGHDFRMRSLRTAGPASVFRTVSFDTAPGEATDLQSRPSCVDKRQLTFYSWTMIESFKHKGLRNLFEQDDGRRIRADQVDRLRLILSALDQASEAQDMNQPAFRLHPLKGNRKGVWAVTVRANWRVTFRFDGGSAYDVDLEDYH
jgi:proteic killer suppression protein